MNSQSPIKYLNSAVVFAEVPGEISLAINITNCPCHCVGCHSPELSEDIGENLTTDILKRLICSNPGITCVCFMGGDCNPRELYKLADWIKSNYDIKVAWYSGRDYLPYIKTDVFDYIKLGRYDQSRGPLNKITTNQRMYMKVDHSESDYGLIGFIDITNQFWNEINSKD